MRNNQPVTNRRRHFDAGQKLISSTNLGGVIQHCNDAFADVSGFTREELIGQPHNMIRHPDMPQVVFHDLWQHLKAGKPWMGLVKNRCKNGDFYWVHAYVTPLFDQGKIIGFESVRVRPAEEDVQRAEKLYQAIAGQRSKSLLQAPLWRWHLESAAVLVPSVALGGWLASAGSGPGWAAALVSVLVPALAMLGLSHFRRARDLRCIMARIPHPYATPFAIAAYTGHDPALGAVETAIIANASHLDTVLTRLDDAASIVAARAEEANALTDASTQAVQAQQQETELVATAMTQMSTAVHQVAGNVQVTADQAADAGRLAQDSRQSAEETRITILNLRDTVDAVCQAVRELANQTGQISSVSDMIEQIAEQTNLLALNAAIEAARAGDAGRGFAVVADEVRQLASRTRNSTQQIQSTVTQLRDRANNAVSAAEEGQRAAEAGVEKMGNTHAMLDSITQSMSKITQMATQMAAAVEEQAQVSEDINRQVVRISDLANISLEKGSASQEKCHQLEKTAEICTILWNA